MKGRKSFSFTSTMHCMYLCFHFNLYFSMFIIIIFRTKTRHRESAVVMCNQTKNMSTVKLFAVYNLLPHRKCFVLQHHKFEFNYRQITPECVCVCARAIGSGRFFVFCGTGGKRKKSCPVIWQIQSSL
jgi:hypothetical protein